MRVLTSGCFDGTHDGHLAFFRNLREAAGYFDVALASDDYIRTVKGREPHYPYDDRKKMVRLNWGVRRVFPHGPDGVWPFLPAYDVLAKGRDWLGHQEIPRGVHVLIIDSGSDVHTSDR